MGPWFIGALCALVIAATTFIAIRKPPVQVDLASATQGPMTVTIDDEGPGVPPEARDAIFNRFHSIRSESEVFGRHSGLGLAIAKAIVDGHDGGGAAVEGARIRIGRGGEAFRVERRQRGACALLQQLGIGILAALVGIRVARADRWVVDAIGFHERGAGFRVILGE